MFSLLSCFFVSFLLYIYTSGHEVGPFKPFKAMIYSRNQKVGRTGRGRDFLFSFCGFIQKRKKGKKNLFFFFSFFFLNFSTKAAKETMGGNQRV